jgi:hypothetical protein
VANRESPSERAHQLLLLLLTPQQRELFLKYYYIDVPCGLTTSYRIENRALQSANIVKYKLGHGRRLCVHIRGYGLPHADDLIAQLLMLRHNASALEKIAEKY